MGGLYVGRGWVLDWEGGLEMCAKCLLFVTNNEVHLVGLNIHEKVILKWILNEQSLSVLIVLYSPLCICC